MRADPFSGAVYVFRAKRADRVKLIFWDGTGVCLFATQLEDGSFRWPNVQDSVMRQMIGVFGDEHMRHRRLGRQPTLDQAGRRGRLVRCGLWRFSASFPHALERQESTGVRCDGSAIGRASRHETRQATRPSNLLPTLWDSGALAYQWGAPLLG